MAYSCVSWIAWPLAVPIASQPNAASAIALAVLPSRAEISGGVAMRAIFTVGKLRLSSR
jgi:hypothetical protein